jgi:hypothetical protein
MADSQHMQVSVNREINNRIFAMTPPSNAKVLCNVKYKQLSVNCAQFADFVLARRETG